MTQLRQRVHGIEEWRAGIVAHHLPEDGPERIGHIGEVVNLWLHTADAEAGWTRGLITRIEAGAHTFADEGPRSSAP